LPAGAAARAMAESADARTDVQNAATELSARHVSVSEMMSKD